MQSALRPYVTTGVAIVGATAIAIAPIAPITHLTEISIPTPPAVVSQAFTMAAFPQDLIDLVNGLVGALGAPAVTDIINNFDPSQLTDFVAVVQGGLLNLAPVVYTLLNGLNNILQTVFDGLVNVVNALTNNQGLQGVLLGLGAGLGIVVNAIFGGLNNSPLADAIAGAITNLFGGLGGLMPAPLAAAGPLAATSLPSSGPTSAAALRTLAPAAADTPAADTPAADAPATDPAPVSGVASDPAAEKPGDVLGTLTDTLPTRSNGARGLEKAITAQAGAPTDPGAPAPDAADVTSPPTSRGQSAPSSGNRGSANASATGKANRDHAHSSGR